MTIMKGARGYLSKAKLFAGGNLNTVVQVAEIVTAYVSRNTVSPAELLSLIDGVGKSLTELENSRPAIVPSKDLSAIDYQRSIGDDYLICLEDGKKFKTLKKHLRTHHQLTPQQYKHKWNLPDDYPMVAAEYSMRRSKIASASRLGKRSR